MLSLANRAIECATRGLYYPPDFRSALEARQVLPIVDAENLTFAAGVRGTAIIEEPVATAALIIQWNRAAQFDGLRKRCADGQP